MHGLHDRNIGLTRSTTAEWAHFQLQLTVFVRVFSLASSKHWLELQSFERDGSQEIKI